MFKFAMLAAAGCVPFVVAQGAFASGEASCPPAAAAKPATAAAPAVPQASQNTRQAYRSYSADPAAPSYNSTANSANYVPYRAPYRSNARSSNLYRADRKIRGLGH